jgi:hypothetical protein
MSIQATSLSLANVAQVTLVQTFVQLVVFATGRFAGSFSFRVGVAIFTFTGVEGFRVNVGVSVRVGVSSFVTGDVVFSIVVGAVVGVVDLFVVVVFTQAPSALGCVPDGQDLQVPGLAPGTGLWPGGQIDVVAPGACGQPLLPGATPSGHGGGPPVGAAGTAVVGAPTGANGVPTGAIGGAGRAGLPTGSDTRPHMPSAPSL